MTFLSPATFFIPKRGGTLGGMENYWKNAFALETLWNSFWSILDSKTYIGFSEHDFECETKTVGSSEMVESALHGDLPRILGLG